MIEVYTSIYNRLVSQLTVPVFDHVPQKQTVFPYVRIDQLETKNGDTDAENGFKGTIQIIAFSRYRGSKEVSALNLQIYNALHRWLMSDTLNYGISSIHQEFSTIATETDGLTRQSIQRFIILFEKH